MRKKIYKFVSVAVIAVAMVVSFHMSKANSATTVSLDMLSKNAMACEEMGDMQGYIGLMRDCNYIVFYFEGEYTYSYFVFGCEDAIDTCTIF